MSETGNEMITNNTAVDGQETGATVQTDNQSGGVPAGNETTNGTLIDTNWTIDAKAIEGMNIDPGLVDSYTEMAKKYGLNQENATSLLKDAVGVLNKMDVDNVIKQRNSWAEDSRNDKEFGGASLDANLAIAKKAVDAYGTPEMKEFLETTGLGNHPEMIRLFYRVGKTLTEDGFVKGNQNAIELDPAKILFPNMN